MRPKIVFSSCLTGEAVRYDGGSAETPFTLKLLNFSEPVKVCPEVGIGLGVPREKVIVWEGGLHQPSTSLDLTQKMEEFSRSFLGSLKEVDGFLLKSKSPSCGVSRTKTYKDKEGKVFKGFGRGMFARAVLEAFPYLPVEDELRLFRYHLRLHFLIRVFGSALIREEGPEVAHDIFSDALRVLSPGLEKRMRREKSGKTYRELFLRAFSRRPPLSLLLELAGKVVPQELLYPPDRLP